MHRYYKAAITIIVRFIHPRLAIRVWQAVNLANEALYIFIVVDVSLRHGNVERTARYVIGAPSNGQRVVTLFSGCVVDVVDRRSCFLIGQFGDRITRRRYHPHGQ